MGQGSRWGRREPKCEIKRLHWSRVWMNCRPKAPKNAHSVRGACYRQSAVLLRYYFVIRHASGSSQEVCVICCNHRYSHQAAEKQGHFGEVTRHLTGLIKTTRPVWVCLSVVARWSGTRVRFTLGLFLPTLVEIQSKFNNMCRYTILQEK